MNLRKRFIVHTRNADIEVSGTTFNVDTYDDDKQLSAVLAEWNGLKCIFNRNDDEKPLECILFPSQKSVYIRLI